MSQQLLNIGTLPNDGTGDTLRAGGDKINDNFTELYGLVDNYRANGAETATAGEHTVSFSSSLGTTDLHIEITDYNGIGIMFVPPATATGFTYNAMTGGVFGWKATKNK